MNIAVLRETGAARRAVSIMPVSTAFLQSSTSRRWRRMDARTGKLKPMTYRLSLFATTLVFLVLISTDLVPHSASAQAWGISNLIIEADRSNYLGQCPTTIRLTGKFEA